MFTSVDWTVQLYFGYTTYCTAVVHKILKIGDPNFAPRSCTCTLMLFLYNGRMHFRLVRRIVQSPKSQIWTRLFDATKPRSLPKTRDRQHVVSNRQIVKICIFPMQMCDDTVYGTSGTMVLVSFRCISFQTCIMFLALPTVRLFPTSYCLYGVVQQVKPISPPIQDPVPRRNYQTSTHTRILAIIPT